MSDKFNSGSGVKTQKSGTGKTMRKTPLKQSVAIDGDMPIDARWKIIKNYDIDIDEI